MAESAAWVLALDHQLRAAVGERELAHLIEVPILLDVPRSPPYCRQVLVWNDTVLPAMDLAAWLRRQPMQRQQPLAGVFAYQTRPGADPEYGALLLSGIPTRTRVDDDGLRTAETTQPLAKPGDFLFPAGRPADSHLGLAHIFSAGLL